MPPPPPDLAPQSETMEDGCSTVIPDHPPPPPPPTTFLSTYIGKGGCITFGYDPHFPSPPSYILPVLNEEQYCPNTVESRRGVNLNKVDPQSSQLNIHKVRQSLVIQIEKGVNL